jgi:hypothetical protein
LPNSSGTARKWRFSLRHGKDFSRAKNVMDYDNGWRDMRCRANRKRKFNMKIDRLLVLFFLAVTLGMIILQQ